MHVRIALATVFVGLVLIIHADLNSRSFSPPSVASSTPSGSGSSHPLPLVHLSVFSCDAHTGLIEDLKDIWGRIPALIVTWVDESLAVNCASFGTCASDAFKAAVSFDDVVLNGGVNDAMIARFDAYIARRFGASPPNVMVCAHPSALCQLFLSWAANGGTSVVLYQAVQLEFTINTPVSQQAWLEVYMRLAGSPRNAVLANNLYHQAETLWLTGHKPVYLPSLCRYTHATYVPGKPRPYSIMLAARASRRNGTRHLFRQHSRPTLPNMPAPTAC